MICLRLFAILYGNIIYRVHVVVLALFIKFCKKQLKANAKGKPETANVQLYLSQNKCDKNLKDITVNDAPRN